MSTETLTTTINENKYSYTQLSATESLRLKFRLAGIIGGAAGEIAQGLGGSDSEQIASFGRAMSNVFRENDPDEIISLIERIFIPAFVNGERVNLDKHYKGEFAEMYQALLWVLKSEYGGFLAEAQSIL